MMANGGTIAAGRAVEALYGGRGISPVMTSSASWPRTGSMCAPVQPCCCKGPWSIGPGETLPLLMQWQAWINSVPGYVINKVVEASLIDVSVSQPADPDIIKVVSGTGDDPDPPDNEDAAALIGLIPPYLTQALIEVSPDATIGAMYRLNIAVTARDCDGRKITMRDCVVIVIAEC